MPIAAISQPYSGKVLPFRIGSQCLGHVDECLPELAHVNFLSRKQFECVNPLEEKEFVAVEKLKTCGRSFFQERRL